MAANWNIDLSHSEIAFSVRHMMFARVRGTFTGWTAEGTIDLDHIARSSVVVNVDVTSIDTRNKDRDAHLRSPDFFDAETYPEMRFESGAIAVEPDGLRVDGQLTIRGTTLPVTLQVEQTGQGTDPWGNRRAGFRAHAEIDRKAFGLTWNQALETGGVLVGDKVRIDIEVEAVQARTEASAEASA